MNELASWMSWLAHGAMWIQVVWFLVACAIGIPWIIRDEIRFRLTAPKPDEVRAHADCVEATHGRDALSVVGEAMVVARKRSDFLTRRFLKEVSGELVRRLVERNHKTSDSASVTSLWRVPNPSNQSSLDLGQKPGTVGPELRQERTR